MIEVVSRDDERCVSVKSADAIAIFIAFRHTIENVY